MARPLSGYRLQGAPVVATFHDLHRTGELGDGLVDPGAKSVAADNHPCDHESQRHAVEHVEIGDVAQEGLGGEHGDQRPPGALELFHRNEVPLALDAPMARDGVPFTACTTASGSSPVRWRNRTWSPATATIRG